MCFIVWIGPITCDKRKNTILNCPDTSLVSIIQIYRIAATYKHLRLPGAYSWVKLKINRAAAGKCR